MRVRASTDTTMCNGNNGYYMDVWRSAWTQMVMQICAASVLGLANCHRWQIWSSCERVFNIGNEFYLHFLIGAVAPSIPSLCAHQRTLQPKTDHHVHKSPAFSTSCNRVNQTSIDWWTRDFLTFKREMFDF